MGARRHGGRVPPPSALKLCSSSTAVSTLPSRRSARLLILYVRQQPAACIDSGSSKNNVSLAVVGLRAHVRSIRRCSWGRIWPSAPGLTIPVTVCAIPASPGQPEAAVEAGAARAASPLAQWRSGELQARQSDSSPSSAAVVKSILRVWTSQMDFRASAGPQWRPSHAVTLRVMYVTRTRTSKYY